jgi:hypothetical protein
VPVTAETNDRKFVAEIFRKLFTRKTPFPPKTDAREKAECVRYTSARNAKAGRGELCRPLFFCPPDEV